MRETTNYKLKKPEGADFANIEDINHNMDIMDTKLKELMDKEVEVVDNLTSTDTKKGLSAAQGKWLNENKLGKTETAHDSTRLGGHGASYYATKAELNNKLGTSSTAYNSTRLNGQEASYYAKKAEVYTHDSNGFIYNNGTKVGWIKITNTSTSSGSTRTKINIGDGDNVYLHEFEDDKLRIRANILHLKGKITAENYPKKTITIPTSNWQDASLGIYRKKYKVTDSTIRNTDFVEMSIAATSLETAENAGFCPTTEEQNGYFYIYAVNVPTTSISATYKVVI